ncbi:MAG: hypothetical protein C5S44_06820 [Candidatus Methanocomedens sp.]|nr:MAG: hypothetical protein C5S44_06820 [ANME-2 cluster archaeon]
MIRMRYLQNYYTFQTILINISTAIDREIIINLMQIEGQLNMINSKIDHFLGFEDLSVDEMKELDEIEDDMKKGNKISLTDSFI